MLKTQFYQLLKNIHYLLNKINNYIKYVCDKSNQLNNSWLVIDMNKNEIKKL